MSVPGWTNIDWVNTLVVVAAVLTAAGIIWRKAVQPVVNGVSEGVALVKEVRAEFHPNGGNSMRDQMDRVGSSLADHAAHDQEVQDQINADLKHVRATLHDLANTATVESGTLELLAGVREQIDAVIVRLTALEKFVQSANQAAVSTASTAAKTAAAATHAAEAAVKVSLARSDSTRTRATDPKPRKPRGA